MNTQSPPSGSRVGIPEDVRDELSPIARDAAGRRTGYHEQAMIGHIEGLSFDALIAATQLWKEEPQERPVFLKVWFCETATRIAEHTIVPHLEKVAYTTAATLMKSSCSEQEIAEIVNQSIETYFSYIPKWDDFRSPLPQKVTSWIGEVAKNKARKWLKRESMVSDLSSEEHLSSDQVALDYMKSASPDKVLEDRETRAALLELLTILNKEIIPGLPQPDRDLWHYYHFDLKSSADEMAQLLGIDARSVQKRWFRLTIKLHNLLLEKLSSSPTVSELFSDIIRDPKCFLGLAVLARMLAADGPAAVIDLAESFFISS
jgi:RNA polymerase sigma factor (sigma-70 family)